jgi:glycerophosphoryl diester phosphodiesterase
MLVIGHRGAAGLAPENTIEAIAAGIAAGADMIEFDIRATKDGELVVIHDARLLRTHNRRESIANLTYAQLAEMTKDKPVPLLTDVLDKFYGVALLNIELKSRGAGLALIQLLKKRYIKKSSDWDNIIISSFMGYELVRIRRVAKKANLALLHDRNPFIFVAYHRFIKLTAVGFHRLYLNKFALEIAHKAKLFTYVYTVNRTGSLHYLADQGIDGIVTNYPDKFNEVLQHENAVN